MGEKKQRVARLLDRKAGSWGTTSAMYFDILRGVFCESKKAIAGDLKRPSRWVYAGMPLLIAGLEAFLIEHQHMLRDNSGVRTIAGVYPLPEVLKLYPLPNDLRLDLEALIEIRNLILHPSPLPSGGPRWPDSLKRLRERKVLDGNIPQSGTDELSLLASHRLFEWAVVTSAQTLDVVITSDDRADFFRGLVRNLWQVLNDRPSLEGL
jgi:hypothetical protein